MRDKWKKKRMRRCAVHVFMPRFVCFLVQYRAPSLAEVANECCMSDMCLGLCNPNLGDLLVYWFDTLVTASCNSHQPT